MTAAELIKARDDAYEAWMEAGRQENFHLAKSGRSNQHLHLNERAAYAKYQELSRKCQENP